jgi:hypothetical protein
MYGAEENTTTLHYVSKTCAGGDEVPWPARGKHGMEGWVVRKVGPVSVAKRKLLAVEPRSPCP